MMFCNGKYAKRPSSTISIDNTPIDFVDEFKYLGFTLTFNRNDNGHIGNMYRGLCTRANMIIRNFSKCNNEVKSQLFNSFCTTFYGIALCIKASAAQLTKIKVCYNKGIRKLYNLRGQVSISEICVRKGLPTLQEIRRKAVAGLLQRLKISHNSI